MCAFSDCAAGAQPRLTRATNERPHVFFLISCLQKKPGFDPEN
jgi:hypothetical protein